MPPVWFAEEVALAAVPQQQVQEDDGRGPGLSSGPQNEPDGSAEHQLPALHELRRQRAQSPDSDGSSGSASTTASGLLAQYEAW